VSESKEKMIISPTLCAWADDENENYHIEVELPGAEKESITMKMHEDSFFLKAETENTVYIGSYAICCPVKAEKAKATYKNGLLKVDVPFKSPLEDAIDISIE
jgi:HSP20 family molecular chaperone IbpA